jgi:hypothetical protein
VLRAGLILVACALAAACGREAEPDPPTGRLVVSSNDDLVVVGVDGSGRRVLVGAPGMQLDADWSPDATLIAYRDSRAGLNVDDEIYVVAADGSAGRNLTRDPANDRRSELRSLRHRRGREWPLPPHRQHCL